MCVAPDGSVFVADWYDPGVGGHGMGDPTDGRIYRITPKGHKGYKVPEVKLDTTEGVLAALRLADAWRREHVAIATIQRDVDSRRRHGRSLDGSVMPGTRTARSRLGSLWQSPAAQRLVEDRDNGSRCRRVTTAHDAVAGRAEALDADARATAIRS